MIIVISIIMAMVFTVIFVLFYDYVQYQWCETLFKNNTVGSNDMKDAGRKRLR